MKSGFRSATSKKKSQILQTIASRSGSARLYSAIVQDSIAIVGGYNAIVRGSIAIVSGCNAIVMAQHSIRINHNAIVLTAISIATAQHRICRAIACSGAFRIRSSEAFDR